MKKIKAIARKVGFAIFFLLFLYGVIYILFFVAVYTGDVTGWYRMENDMHMDNPK